MIRSVFRQCIKISMISLVLASCAKQAVKPEVEINKSPNDARNYSSIILENKLQVILISDPTLETAGASLSVGVGSFQNPENLPGLAHFVEHMLFLGTEKYPEVNSFQKFIKENAGSSNAYTAAEHTNYFFEVSESALVPALDRFSDYFKTPTFNATYIEKERNAVNSEWSLSKADDGRILHRLRGVTANQKHPLQRISVGNTNTLKNDDHVNLSEKAKEFYKKYYSSNNMNLVLFGNKSVAELSQLAQKNFSTIKNKNIEKPKVDVMGLTESVQGQHIYYKPKKPIKKLVIEFPILNSKSDWKMKANSYLGNIISSEEPNTLAAVLRKKGWVSNLTVNTQPFFYGKDGFMTININLTDLGLRHENEIISDVFNYLKLIEKSGVNKTFHLEAKLIMEKSYRNMQTPTVLMQAVHFSATLFDRPVKHLIDSPYYYDAFNKNEILNTLAEFTPEHARIWHINPGAHEKIKLVHYDGSYSIEKITENDKTIWGGSQYKFSLPSANDLINTENTVVVPTQLKSPKKVFDKQGIEAWIVHSQYYQSELGRLDLVFNTKEPHRNVSSWVMADLVNRIFSMQTTPLQDKAGRAGIGISISRPKDNHAISLTGYSEKHEVLYKDLLQKWLAFDTNNQELRIALEGFERWVKGQKEATLNRQLFIELNRSMKIPSWQDTEILAAARKITLSDVRQYVENMLRKNRIRIFAYGNYKEATITSIAKYTEKIQSNNREPEPRYFTEYVTPVAGKFKQYKLETEQNDNALLLAVYSPEPTLEVAANIALLNTLFHNAFYTELRTEEQIGYVVGSTYDRVADYWGFVMYVQTTNTSLKALSLRFSVFVADFITELHNMDENMLSQLKRSVIAQIEQKPENFTAESGAYFLDFYRGNDDFNSKQRIIEAINETDKVSIIALYEELLMNEEGLKIKVQIQGSKLKNEPLNR